MKRVTIKDIAEELGISVSTVSRAMTNDHNIRQQTKEQVLAMAEKMGYRPNPVATNLKYGRSNTIGVIVPEMTTPYAAEVIGGIQEVLHEVEIKVLIAESHESWQSERENVETMEQFMVDGLIINLCDYKSNKDIYTQLQRDGMPLVFFDRIPHEMEVSQVIVDDYIKSFMLVEHLIRSSRRRIVHLEGVEYLYNSTERYRGYRDALVKFGIKVDPQLVIPCKGLSFKDGADGVDQLVDQGVEFDALFAFTDTLAIGALNRLRERGISVPKDVAVASFSGTTLSTIVYPQLTSVESPLREMGREAAHLIIEQIKDPSAPIRSVVLDAEIRLRASTDECD